MPVTKTAPLETPIATAASKRPSPNIAMDLTPDIDINDDDANTDSSARYTFVYPSRKNALVRSPPTSSPKLSP
jgi:hypothetical protein